jgi:ornithine cyclodeaminase/alanine dehydrogenase-like protein (mu-crystallin family)
MPLIRFLSRADVQQALGMHEAISLMREAFIALSEGRASVPVRLNVPMPEYNGRALFMPVYLPDTEHVGLKVVTVHPDNPTRGLPFIHALVMVTDAATGRPVAVMDGEYLTALRTGAGAGLATDLLACPDAEVAAIFGAGVQGRTQLEAVCAVRPIRRAYVFSRSRDNAAAFAQEMSTRLALDVQVADDPETLGQADVVCTATTSLAPVFSHPHLKPGVHINGIGSYRPDMAEIPPDTVLAAKVVVDHRPACLAEAGDLIQLLERGLITENHIHAELGEIAAGHKAGRTSDDDVTFFKSVGNAVQDLAAASHVVAEAEARGLGTAVTL